MADNVKRRQVRRAGVGTLPLALAALAVFESGGAAAVAQQAAPLDLSAPLSFANGQCRFSPAIDRALTDMLYWDEGRRTFATRAVRIGEMRLTPLLMAGPPAGGGRLYRSSVRLAGAARWHGLNLVGLGAAAGPEYRRRELRFAEPVATVRSRLRAMGTALPAPPAVRHIPSDSCAASIAVEALGRGSALVCTNWC